MPVNGLTPDQRLAFDDGGRAFSKLYGIADGLGPVFNDQACVACHGFAGSATNRSNMRFGRRDGDGFDPLVERGGTLVQSRGIDFVTTGDGTVRFLGEGIPDEANVSVVRRTQSLQGLGFVDAVPDATWRAIAAAQLAADPQTAGRVHEVRDVRSRATVVGKFGWKAQMPTLLQAASEALLNEQGITNPLFPNEVCPQGECRALAFNPVPGLNDDGTDVTALTAFMTMLAAPPRGRVSGMALVGEDIFSELGCASCHLPTIQTGPSGIAALDHTSFHPYSDFLLHDMGSLGDGIDEGGASGNEMRTAPLWGLRTATRFLHDGSAVTIVEAIMRHDGQARASRDRFAKLGAARTDWLLTFLRSL
jgi:CxxC motif-containing protein (DUF1111 family)